MKSFERLTLMLAAAGLTLAACAPQPSPYPGPPWVAPNGQVIQPPPQGWPSYEKGFEGRF